MKSLIDYEPFFSKYKSKDIVYPNAVARHFGITLKEAYNLCQSKIGNDLKLLYIIKCPVCSHTLSGRYYSVSSIDNECEYGCTNCDTEFTVNFDEDVIVYFEKI